MKKGLGLQFLDNSTKKINKDTNIPQKYILPGHINRYITSNFSTLEKADATRINPGENKSIGTFHDLSFKSTSPEKLVLFLLESQIVTTYWHLKSDVCLEKEENENGIYKAYFSGLHKYCTNECQSDPLKFIISINRKSGEMTLSSK